MLDLVDLYRYAETCDIMVYEMDTEGEKSLSLLFHGSERIAIDNDMLKTNAEKKREFGHELGHCRTGSFYNVHSKFEVISKRERRADIWAIKKLIPEDELHRAVCEGNTEMWQLAEYFDLPQDFIEMAVCYYEGIE